MVERRTDDVSHKDYCQGSDMTRFISLLVLIRELTWMVGELDPHGKSLGNILLKVYKVERNGILKRYLDRRKLRSGWR